EHTLANYGISSREIIKIRQKVIEGVELKDGYRWNNYYVNAVIQIVRETYVRKTKNKHASQIKHMGAYLYKMLMQGWLIDQVEQMRREGAEPISAQLDVFKQFENLRDSKMYEKVAEEPFRTDYASFKEMYQLHKEVHQSDISEAEYAFDLGYEIRGDYVEKVR
ncbi:MAG: hypothetical protein AAF399_07815, partial [Bacteroidota bacterium]